MVKRHLPVGCTVLGSLLFFIPTAAFCSEPPKVERAMGIELQKASGHFHRARTHLLAAIREFDKGNEVVNPDSLMDSEEWRSRLLDRIQDLDRVLNPQPRVTEEGVRYEPAPELIGVQ